MDKDSSSKNGGPYLNTAEAARYVGLAQKTLEKMRVVGGGPKFRKHGRYVRYVSEDLDHWSDRRSRESTSDDEDIHDAPIRKYRRLTLGLLGIVAAAIPVSLALPLLPRIVWNASDSAPLGLYWLSSAAIIRRGDLVLADLPSMMRRLAADRRYLPDHVRLVKRIAALAGDRICSLGTIITINGRTAATRLVADAQGRALPHWKGCQTVGQDEVFLLMPQVPASFDGRYFGTIRRTAIVGKLAPLWIW